MTGRPEFISHRPGEFAHARAQAEVDTLRLRNRAARTVAGQAINDDDRSRLLSMLGLEEMGDHPDSPRRTEPEVISPRAIELGLAGYVRAVATELGVPAEATGFEISDTVTAYLGLPDRCPDSPNRDLMLVWNERDGWLVAVETQPTEPTRVLGYLGGQDILPHPRTIATFVTHLLSGQRPDRPRPVFPPLAGQDLATLLRRHHATPVSGSAVTGHRFNRLP